MPSFLAHSNRQQRLYQAMPQYTEEEVRNALKDLRAGAGQRETAAKWAIPLTILRRRIKGGQTSRKGYERFQRLSQV